MARHPKEDDYRPLTRTLRKQASQRYQELREGMGVRAAVRQVSEEFNIDPEEFFGRPI